MKRWGHMARVFTKLGKEITIAVKAGGPDVTGNPRLRALMAEARAEQMSKENMALTESHILLKPLPTTTHVL